MGGMERFVLLLRGVNVGGVKVPMAGLVDALAAAGLGSVRTVLATGNVVLDAAQEAEQVLSCAQRAVADRFGRPISMLIYSRAQMLDLDCGDFPLPASAEEHRYLTFTRDAQAAQELAAALGRDVGGYQLRGPVLFWTAAKGASTDSALAAALQRLSSRHLWTTRNLNTVQKVLKLL